MRTRSRAAAAIPALLITSLLLGCTGGSESNAAEETMPSKQAPPAPSQINARRDLGRINPAIPIYDGADFRDDLTRRDEAMIRNKFGSGARVYTLASDDSFPQVYHYYTTYLAQFRAFPATDPYPPEKQQWRTFEVSLTDAMQDPFIPGEAMDRRGKQVTLQVAETEAEPKTVIRYIVTDVAPPAAPITTAAVPPSQPVAR
jgi:hypothetical protein